MRDPTSASAKRAQPEVAAPGRGGRGLSLCVTDQTDPAAPEPAISMRIRGGSGASFRARRSVLSQLDGRLTESGASDLAVIISELVTNSVLHADVGPDQTLTVDCAALGDRLRITVTDPGSHLEPHLRSRDVNANGGYGLAIVATLSLAWGVVRSAVGTTSVWCELPLDTSPLRASS